MIIPSQGLRIVLAVHPVDFRCGHDALAGLVQNRLGLDPHSGLIVVFRSKRMDRLKILLWDGTGEIPLRVGPKTSWLITKPSEHEADRSEDKKASALRLRFSQSLLNLRQRPSQTIVR